MKKFLLVLVFLSVLFSGCTSIAMKSSESGIQHIPSYDGYPIEGYLAMPEGGKAEKVVIYVNGSGPNTYDNRRQIREETTFTYFDLFREEFTKAGVAFFSYNTRGASLSEEPPIFTEVDDLLYRGYTPHASVKDVVAIVQHLRQQQGLKDAKVILLGWSEGTLIAPLASLKVPVDGMVLCGFMYDDMMTILDWQQTGGSSMVFYRNYFDYDKDGFVSPEEFAEDRNGIAAHLGITYEFMDQDKNGVLDEDDFAILLEPSRTELYQAIETGDREYLKHTYGIYLTPEWFDAHKLMPSNSEVLPFIDAPIHIIHGTFDQNASVEGVYKMQQLFEQLGKENLSISVYEGYNHDLNYLDYIFTQEIPEGLAKVFSVAIEM